MRRILPLLALAALALVLARPALGQEETTTTSQVTETVTGKTPAVVVEEPPPAEAQAPWTTRFLVPTGLVLGAVAVFATVVVYFLRVVRARYRVVE
jgi:hypothetical protein